MSYERQQEKINDGQLDMRVMALLVVHQCGEDGIQWNEWTIAAHLQYDDVEAVLMALRRLKERGWVTAYRKEWRRTTDGVRDYQDEIRRPTLPVSEHAFKEEALTGMDSRGNRSTLTWAALHGKEPRRISDNVLMWCSHVRDIRAIAEQHGLTDSETKSLLESGEIHVCKGYKKMAHWGRFNKKGRRWQHRCRDCMSEMMKDIRKRNKCKTKQK